MNAKRMMKCLLATVLMALLVLQTVPALAVDVEPTNPDPVEITEPTDPATEPSPTPTGDGSEGNDTTEPENPPESPETDFTATTLEELLQAIEEAEDGATIGVGCIINCMEETNLGSPDKTVTIRRIAPEGNVAFSSEYGTGTATIQNIIFDGANIDSVFSFVVSNIPSTFENCSFINCSGGNGAGLYLTGRNTVISGCTFESNSGQQGAHLRIDSGAVTISDSSFTDGAAIDKGGAIVNYSEQQVTMTGCTITGNTTSAQHGGGIWNSGTLDVAQCKIYGNTANGEVDDLVNEYWGRLGLMDDHNALVALYAADGVTPNKWAVDTFKDGIEPGSTPNMVFSMTFADNDPAPEPEPDPDPEPSPEPDPIPEPEPTPDPEPEPEPTPEPEPEEPYRPSYTRPSTIKKDKPKEITLTNGKAVLKAPDALYWVGYKDSRGGGAEAITRADLAQLVYSLMDADSRETYGVEQAPFDDVGPGSWSAPAMGTMTNTGIMVGCGNGLFLPDRVLTWGELITVFARFAEDEEPPEIYTGDHWAKDAINTAFSLGWLEPSEAFDPGGIVSAGEMVSFIQTVFQWAGE